MNEQEIGMMLLRETYGGGQCVVRDRGQIRRMKNPPNEHLRLFGKGYFEALQSRHLIRLTGRKRITELKELSKALKKC